MKKNIMRIGLVFIITIILISVNITLATNTNTEIIKNQPTSIEKNNDNFQTITNKTDSMNNDDCHWWPMYKNGPSHCSYSESKAPETNNLKWTFSKSGGGNSPAVVNNKLYICIGSKFYCLDIDTGDIIWTVSNLLSWGAPAVINDRVYVAGFYYFVCLDADDGEQIWLYDTGGVQCTPCVVSEDKIYYGNENHKVLCLDINDGTVLWTYTAGSVVRSTPAVSDGRVYFGSHDYNLYCLDANDGSVLWTYTAGSEIAASPAISDGRVFFGSYDSNMYCLNAYTGEKYWSFEILKNWQWIRSAPAVAYGNVYFGADDTKIYCLDANDGQMIWNYDTSYANMEDPSVADDKVFVGASYSSKDFTMATDYIKCLNAYTGEQIWQKSVNGGANSPAIANGKVYVCSENGKVYCFGDDEPNLYCEGSLRWFNATPGSLLKGNFTVENIGGPGTNLSWKIIEWPSWGSWIFIPSKGEGLKPEDGPVNILVIAFAPFIRKEYNGFVKVVNEENSCDYREVPITLSTPKNKVIENTFLSFLQDYHNLYLIFLKLLQKFK